MQPVAELGSNPGLSWPCSVSNLSPQVQEGVCKGEEGCASDSQGALFKPLTSDVLDNCL